MRWTHSLAWVSVAALIVGSPLFAQEPSATGVIRGTIIDEGSVPIPEANVEVVREDGFVLSTESNELGEFGFESVPAGSYELRAVYPGFVTSRVQSLQVEPAQEIAMPSIPLYGGNRCGIPAPEHFTLVRETPGTGAVSGIVRAINEDSISLGGPVNGVAVTLTCEDGRVCGSTTTDERGRFEIGGLAPGPYWMEFRKTNQYGWDGPWSVWTGLNSFSAQHGLAACADGDCSIPDEMKLICE